MLLENLFKQEVSYMSTQLSNLVYDLEHNALLAKQFMYSHDSLVANYEIPSAEKLLLSARNLSDLNTLGLLQNSSDAWPSALTTLPT